MIAYIHMKNPKLFKNRWKMVLVEIELINKRFEKLSKNYVNFLIPLSRMLRSKSDKCLWYFSKFCSFWKFPSLFFKLQGSFVHLLWTILNSPFSKYLSVQMKFKHFLQDVQENNWLRTPPTQQKNLLHSDSLSILAYIGWISEVYVQVTAWLRFPHSNKTWPDPWGKIPARGPVKT